MAIEYVIKLSDHVFQVTFYFDQQFTILHIILDMWHHIQIQYFRHFKKQIKENQIIIVYKLYMVPSVVLVTFSNLDLIQTKESCNTVPQNCNI